MERNNLKWGLTSSFEVNVNLTLKKRTFCLER